MEQKGYPKDWIDKRLRGMAVRQNLTDEWKERGIENQKIMGSAKVMQLSSNVPRKRASPSNTD